MNRVAITYDVDGWAWHRRARGIARYAPQDYIVQAVGQRDVSDRTIADVYLHQSWIDALHGINLKKTWALVANSGLMYDYSPGSNSYAARCASRSKNITTARSKLPQYRGVVSINFRATEFCETINPNTIYLRTGVDTQLFTPRPFTNTGKLRVGWCGKAFDDPAKWTPKGYHEILLPLMKRLGDKVEWVINRRSHDSALDTEAMLDWYAGIDVLLVTSSSEGTPSTLLEALACGRGAVSTNVGVAFEFRRDGVFMVPAYGNAQETVSTISAMEAILSEMTREEAQEMGELGRREVDRGWSWRLLSPIWLKRLCREV